MDPAALDQRIAFWRLTGDRDAAGIANADSWFRLGEAWACRRDLTDVERARAAQLQVEVSARFTVRAGSLTRDLRQGDSITDAAGVRYDVKATRDPYSDDPARRRMWLEIGAMARAAPGLEE